MGRPCWECVYCGLLKSRFSLSGRAYSRGEGWTSVASYCREAPASEKEEAVARIDSYLTRKAAAIWDGALVVDHGHTWTLRRPGHEDVTLAADPPTPAARLFTTAREALYQLIDAEEESRGRA